MTLLDVLVAALRDAGARGEGLAPPAAILWTDPERQWQPLLGLLATRLPELVSLGSYAPEVRTGPAIWIRCLVDRTLDEPSLPKDRPPIVYLPRVGRQDLRAGEACAPHLRPLVELMYRGALWLQKGGRDWTLGAYASSAAGLGLDLAGDAATKAALPRALRELAEVPLPTLRGRRLEAEDFDRLLSRDAIRDLLRWLGDPAGTRARMDDNAWGAFGSRCRDELGFDPISDPPILAGERLGGAKGPWEKVWERFAEAPSSYPGLPELLRRSRPGQASLFRPEAWPDLNDEAEVALRQALEGISTKPHLAACDAVLALETQHAPRRTWVWARLGLSPLAAVLEPLARLARAARTSLGGGDPEELAQVYVARGWQGDAASWEALALAPATDAALVARIVRHLLEPWLDEAARRFQTVLATSPLPALTAKTPTEAPVGGCLLFADGLRYDLGRRLAERLEAQGFRVELARGWAALPSVTATAKPAVSPARDAFVGLHLGADFAPRTRTTDRPVDAAILRATLADAGYQVLDPTDPSDHHPRTEGTRGWIEDGKIDELGHSLEARLARQLDDELARLVERIRSLCDAGWTSVRVVTDHGWLFLPGGLPKVSLPKHLTETRWARAAVLAGASSPDTPTFAWSWNPRETFATPPGIACFGKSPEYAHGGLSLQECLVPDLLVHPASPAARRVTIASITWKQMRCFIEVEGASLGLSADLRLGSPTGPSVATAKKPVGEDGSVSLLLKGDEHERAELVLVLVDPQGSVLAHRPTRVGAQS